ncbi:unnamed protein product, partial [Ixodes hexagonus]
FLFFHRFQRLQRWKRSSSESEKRGRWSRCGVGGRELDSGHSRVAAGRWRRGVPAGGCQLGVARPLERGPGGLPRGLLPLQGGCGRPVGGSPGGQERGTPGRSATQDGPVPRSGGVHLRVTAVSADGRRTTLVAECGARAPTGPARGHALLKRSAGPSAVPVPGVVAQGCRAGAGQVQGHRDCWQRAACSGHRDECHRCHQGAAQEPERSGHPSAQCGSARGSAHGATAPGV